MKKKTEQNVVNEALINENLIKVSGMKLENLLEEMNTALNGHSEMKAAELIVKYGENIISHEKPESVFRRLFNAFVNPFTVVLFVLAMISLFTDVILADPGDRDFTTVIVITTMVAISGFLRFIQETRSNNSAEKLKSMVKITATVEREGKKEIELSEIVPGDIVYLAAGDMIPADVRIISSKDLFVSQSALTGESEPVEKYGTEAKQNTKNPLELSNLAFMGSNVISGSATCVVLATGDYTFLDLWQKQLQLKRLLQALKRV